MRVGVFEAGHALGGRKCPIDGNKIESCIGCKTCSIMSGFGGAGAFQMENTISPMILAVLYMNISVKRILLIRCAMSIRSIWHMAARGPNYTLPQAVVLKTVYAK